MPSDAIGLDIGGANLKVATASGRAVSRPFELWRHPDRLADELAALAPGLPADSPVGVTMTGELCDCFATKREGVRHILAAVGRVFPPARTRVWATTGEFLDPDNAAQHPLVVAAANWHALATYVGRFAPKGTALLVDTGSTTTDLVPLQAGRPTPVGRTDPARLHSGELIYTGVRRTPVCAVLGETVAAELFATTLDVYLFLRKIPEEPDNLDTADGRPATVACAGARLNRMLCGDAEDMSSDGPYTVSEWTFKRQRSMISAGIRRVSDLLAEPPRTFILSGAGEFLARSAVNEAIGNARPVQLISLAERLGPAISGAACAFAVAVLAESTP